jgi:hypothetical protein
MSKSIADLFPYPFSREIADWGPFSERLDEVSGNPLRKSLRFRRVIESGGGFKSSFPLEYLTTKEKRENICLTLLCRKCLVEMSCSCCFKPSRLSILGGPSPHLVYLFLDIFLSSLEWPKVVKALGLFSFSLFTFWFCISKDFLFFHKHHPDERELFYVSIRMCACLKYFQETFVRNVHNTFSFRCVVVLANACFAMWNKTRKDCNE